MFGGALLDSLVKLFRDALDRYAWYGDTSMVPIWNHFGTIISTLPKSVKFLTGRSALSSFSCGTEGRPVWEYIAANSA